MSIHKLQTERGGRDSGGTSVNIALTSELYDIAEAVVRARAVRACDLATRSLPVFRLLRWSVHRKVNDLFDDLALDVAFSAQRIGAGAVLLSAPGLFISATGHDKGSYCSCVFQVWAESRLRADEAAAHLQSIAGALRLRDETFVLDWHFCAGNGDLRSASFEEVANDVLLDEAYPSLGASVEDFVRSYIESPEAVLILLGPPGGGKTRLVREILASMTRRKGENAEVMYTSDKRALASDELFVQFITGTHDALVIEDIDHLLRARTSGNEEMHRFLGIADGIARAQGRKLIFTTNLPNVNDIDPALTRPGRCYAVKTLRGLDLVEAKRLARRICGSDASRAEIAVGRLTEMGVRSYSVAQVYRACS
jgi:ATPase family protein associated with various cellular activities (AAA)